MRLRPLRGLLHLRLLKNSRFCLGEIVKNLTKVCPGAGPATCTKTCLEIGEILCILTIDFFLVLWYNNSVKGRAIQVEVIAPRKNFSKFFQKPLDKPQVLWYNIYVIKRGSPFHPSVEQMDAKSCAKNFPQSLDSSEVFEALGAQDMSRPKPLVHKGRGRVKAKKASGVRFSQFSFVAV